MSTVIIYLGYLRKSMTHLKSGSRHGNISIRSGIRKSVPRGTPTPTATSPEWGVRILCEFYTGLTLVGIE